MDTLRLGSRTNAINATHRPIPIASISSQCPVKTQMHTILTLSENESNSAPVNLPQTPKDILLPSEHGLMIYWHMGNNRNANATVAITAKKQYNLWWCRHTYTKCFTSLGAFQLYNKIIKTLLCTQWHKCSDLCSNYHNHQHNTRHPYSARKLLVGSVSLSFLVTITYH